MTIGYTEFVDKLHQAGNKTTRLGNGEADFQDYGNALDENVQAMITDSFDTDQDYELQAKIASIYQQYGASVLQRGDFMKILRANGLEVSASSVRSNYIIDNKATGKYNNSNIDGNANIGIYTISDGKGGEIIIADANGNGALEIEEVFMNQILSDVAVDVDKIKTTNEGFSAKMPVSEIESIVAETEKNNEVSQDNFNSVVESYLKMGLSETSSVMNAISRLDVEDNMKYTGNFLADAVKDEESTVNGKQKQSSFDKLVNSLVSQGKSLEEAVSIANEQMDVDLEYTGTIKEAA